MKVGDKVLMTDRASLDCGRVGTIRHIAWSEIKMVSGREVVQMVLVDFSSRKGDAKYCSPDYLVLLDQPDQIFKELLK